jgi:hypothetical protein
MRSLLIITFFVMSFFLLFSRDTTSRVVSTPPIDIPDFIKHRIDRMAHPQNCGKPDFSCLLECMPYKYSCLLEAHGPCLLVPHLNRNFMSGSETVAWAVRTALEEPNNKYKALAFLALGQCGELYGHEQTNRKEINDNKLAAYEYTVNNYVAGWRDDDPWNHHGPREPNEGAAYKVGETYRDEELDDCDHKDELSIIQIARPGIAVVVCAEEDGDPNNEEGCTPELIGPGTFGLRSTTGHDLNDRASYIRVYRKF